MIEHWLTANSLCYHIGNMACISRMFDSYRFLRCSPFWFLNLLEYLAKQFSSPVLIFCFGWQQLHSRFLASYRNSNAYICHHIMMTIVYASKYSRIVSLFCLIFSDTKMLFFGLLFILYLYQWSRQCCILGRIWANRGVG